jgi:hypothetical protein
MYELGVGARTSLPLPSPAGGLETIKESFDVGVFFAVEGTLSEMSRLRLVLAMSFSKGVSCEGGIVGYSAPRDSR